MNNSEMYQSFCKETARINKTIYLAASSGQSMSHDLYEFLTRVRPESIGRCLGEVPPEVFEAIETGNKREMNDPVASYLTESGKLGFLLLAATPVMLAPGFYSWGYERTYWVYGDTMEEAIEEAFKFVSRCREEEQEGKAA